jgi:hypothetical protein
MLGRIASLVMAFAAIAGVFSQIWIVSDWAFWFMVGAYLLWLGVNRWGKHRFKWILMLTIVLTLAANVGVFVEIWIAYCLTCECYPDGATAAIDPMSTDRPRQVASQACSVVGAVGGSGPT